jgi:fluoroacetyl-CoA thioesterase
MSMKETLKAGIEHELRFRVPESKTVPALYPESAEFQVMPRVFATGYMVGLIEWACIQAINPHIDWPNEQTVGISINVNHTAATPPGLEVRAGVKLIEVDGRRLIFEVQLHDGVDTISKGIHERFIINAEKFNSKLREKAEARNLQQS